MLRPELPRKGADEEGMMEELGLTFRGVECCGLHTPQDLVGSLGSLPLVSEAPERLRWHREFSLAPQVHSEFLMPVKQQEKDTALVLNLHVREMGVREKLMCLLSKYTLGVVLCSVLSARPCVPPTASPAPRKLLMPLGQCSSFSE